MGSEPLQRQALPAWMQALTAQWPVLALALGAWGGALGYFSLTFEAPWTLLAGGLLALSMMALLAARRLHDWYRHLLWTGLALLGLGAGIGLAHMQVQRAEAALDWQQLNHPVWVQGRVAEVYPVAKGKPGRPDRVWLVLADAKLFLSDGARHIEDVRVTVDARKALPIGAGVAAQVQLWRPEAPGGPMARDYRVFRFLDTQHLRGYVRGEFHESAVSAPEPPSWLVKYAKQAMTWFADRRAAIAQDLAPFGDGVVPALLVGEERFIPDRVVEAYRMSGLAHLLAISGFQLTVVGGGLFWLFRRGLNRVPNLALYTDTRLWAAVLAWPVAVFYTLLAGAEVGLVRACLMMGALFLAFIVGRTRGLVRTWALALLVMVLIDPAVVLRAGFTLSFVAVLALVLWGQGMKAPASKGTWLTRGGRIFRETVLVSTVAGVATLPVVALYFGQVSLIGVVANMLAVPVMAMLTWLGMGLLVLWPLGWHAEPARVMGWGVEWVNQWAVWLADLPLASVMVPKWFGWIALLLCLPLMWHLLNRTWRTAMLWGAGLVGCTVLMAHLVPDWQEVVSAGGTTPLSVEVSGLVVRPDGPNEEDCRLARVVLADRHAVVPAACAEVVLRAGTYMWAARREGGDWQVAQPRCTRPWQRASTACGREW